MEKIPICSIKEIEMHFTITREEYLQIFKTSGIAGLDILTYGHSKELIKAFEKYDKMIPLVDDNNENYVIVTRGDGKCFENSVCGNDIHYEFNNCNIAKEIQNVKEKSVSILIEDFKKQGIDVDRSVLEATNGAYWPENDSPHPLDLKSESILGKLLDTFPFTLSVIDGDGAGRSYISNGNKDYMMYIYLKNYHFSRMIPKSLFVSAMKQNENTIPFIVLNEIQ